LKQIKLNAATWIGIIVSMIWFNLFMGYFLYYRAQGPNQYLEAANNACDSALQAGNDIAILIERKDERVAKQAENRAKWKQCRADIQPPYRRRLDHIYRRIPFVAAAGLGTVTFGWLIAWLAIQVSSRIRRRSYRNTASRKS
jgi:hypothetical protein